VFKFLHIYTSRIGLWTDSACFALDNSTHDQQSINTLTSEFDCVLEMREETTGTARFA